MTVLQQISNPYLASLILGLLYGLTFCASACLPYIISYIAGIGAGFKKGAIITSLQFRTYSGICPHRSNSGAVRHVIGEELFSSYQHYSSIAFVAVIVVVGVNIFMKKFGTCTTKEPNRLASRN
jgi:hypothetical protein